MECGKFEKYIKLAMLECADRDSELFCTIDTSGVAALPRLEKRIQKLIGKRTKAGVNRFQYKRRRAYKLVGVIAAVLMILYLSLSVYAGTKGMSAVDLIILNFDKFVSMEAGESIEINNSYFVKNGESYKYKTVEDAVSKGGLDIMYPSVLPEGVHITQIEHLYSGIGDDYHISIVNSNNIFVSARNHDFTDKKYLEKNEVYEVNGCTYYLTVNDIAYFAFCQYDGLEYYIQCKDKDDLMLIIDNMKKVS